ncbi:ribonuclease HIII [Paucilactobacillus hokkaidonensis JCM 18461]|uniref:Ribonuclease HIII n=2 Tax=Paucilactobacillus hokkaidonensis TaxID=1193095 RepID=A0A0A1GZY6_9LACO|nr:ribonuclease HIII [Paucilactobacillus hokkaidonensis]BAP86036.1 ribonuclease HIII [Paucilactobacillus hokkaidonensis JCM 18461]
MQEVLSFAKSQLNNMQKTYAPFTVAAPSGAIFRAKKNGVTITAYRSGKVMFQGNNTTVESKQWQANATKKVGAPTPTGLPQGFANWSVLGSDEVGTGSYFGPLTVAAVYVDAAHLDRVRQLGIQDSKKLTDPEIIRMAKQLLTFLPYHVVNLMPVKYNQLMKQYNQGQLKALCHNLALQTVIQKISPTKPDGILIDQFVAPATYYHYLKGQSKIISENVYFQIKGEQAHLAVAAASIIARYISLLAMDQLTEQAKLTLPIGAGNAVDQIAAKLLHEGKSLDQFAKTHFANTQKAIKIAKRYD